MESKAASQALHLEVEFKLSRSSVGTDADVDIHGCLVVGSNRECSGGCRTVIVETPPFRSTRFLVNGESINEMVRLKRAVCTLVGQVVLRAVASALSVVLTKSEAKAITHVFAHRRDDRALVSDGALAGQFLILKVILEECVGGLVVV